MSAALPLSPSPAIPPVVAVLAHSTAQGSAGCPPARSSLLLCLIGQMTCLIARDGFCVAPPPHGTVVSDPLGRPNSRRPRGASVPHGGLASCLGGSPEPDCRGLRAPAFLIPDRHGRALLLSAPVRERDGCAPIPIGCATVASLRSTAPGKQAVATRASGSPAGARPLCSRLRRSRQAVGCALVCLASPIRLTGKP